MPTRVLEEIFEIDRSDAQVSETDISIATGEGLQNIWEYEVPTGMSLVFTREDTIHCYLENTAAAEAAAGSLVDAVVYDSPRQNMRALLQVTRYATVKEFQDLNLFRHLDIPEGEEIIAREGERVVVRGNILTATLDASDSYFKLTCKRIRHSPLE